jgi:hypothetical protein
MDFKRGRLYTEGEACGREVWVGGGGGGLGSGLGFGPLRRGRILYGEGDAGLWYI